MYGISIFLMFIIGIIIAFLGLIVQSNAESELWDGIGTFILIIGCILFFCGWLIPVIVYSYYETPKINQMAHEHCKAIGYDTFESWDGIGLFPEKFAYVKCKFVENRQDIQGTLNAKVK